MSTRRVERGGAFVDVADDVLLVNHEGDAVGKQASEIEDSVSLSHLLFGVAQQRKARAGFLSKLAVSFLVVETDPQDLRARGLELGDISLIRSDLFGSTRG